MTPHLTPDSNATTSPDPRWRLVYLGKTMGGRLVPVWTGFEDIIVASTRIIRVSMNTKWTIQYYLVIMQLDQQLKKPNLLKWLLIGGERRINGYSTSDILPSKNYFHLVRCDYNFFTMCRLMGPSFLQKTTHANYPGWRSINNLHGRVCWRHFQNNTKT